MLTTHFFGWVRGMGGSFSTPSSYEKGGGGGRPPIRLNGYHCTGAKAGGRGPRAGAVTSPPICYPLQIAAYSRARAGIAQASQSHMIRKRAGADRRGR